MEGGDTLAKFFGCIKHYNGGEEIDDGLKKKIEAHFEFLWSNDRNLAVKSELDKSIFLQLP